MKGDWLIIALLTLSLAVFCAVIGADWMLVVLGIVRQWLLTVPSPTEHFATLLGAFAWPLAILLVVWWLKRPIQHAATKLAERFEHDDVEVPGWLKVTNKQVATYSPEAVAQQPAAPEKADVNHAEALLEYASNPGAANKVIDWIWNNVGSNCDIEAFFGDPMFAEEREAAYKELIEGPTNG